MFNLENLDWQVHVNYDDGYSLNIQVAKVLLRIKWKFKLNNTL